MKTLFSLLFLLFSFSFSLQGKDFTIVSYNVENLFDLKKDGTEYKEYIPHTKTWNPKAYQQKIKNITQILKDIDGQIVALQEIESFEALQGLLKENPKYRYYKFAKNNSSAVGVAVLSIYPIVETSTIEVDKYDPYTRDILKVVLDIHNNPLTLYINHWRSKRAPESKRIIYAMALKKELEKLNREDDYIILGDLNSNYNEFQTFKYDKNLNDSFGITGINQILNTTIEKNFVTLHDMLTLNQNIHYNLWLDYEKERLSTIFRQENNTPDNIIISKGLLDTKGVSYIPKSFQVFHPTYLINHRKINRWNTSTHSGYSDHLPILASFSTKPQNYQPYTVFLKSKNSIEKLYQLQTVSHFALNDVVVIYHKNNRAIITAKDDRAIMIYNPPKSLEVGYRYNIVVDSIDLFNGAKQITKLSDIQKLHKVDNYKEYYLDGEKNNLFERRNQNNIIKNLTGVYKNGFLYFQQEGKEKRIKLYFHKKLTIPQKDRKITINSGHLSIYRSQIQIVLYSYSDYSL